MTEFKKLSDVDLINNASETANILVEDGGEIKRLPSSNFSSGGGKILEVHLNLREVGPSFDSINMTFDELKQYIPNCKQLGVIYQKVNEDGVELYGTEIIGGIFDNIDYITIESWSKSLNVYPDNHVEFA